MVAKQHALITIIEPEDPSQRFDPQPGSFAGIESIKRLVISCPGLGTALWVLFEHFWGLWAVFA